MERDYYVPNINETILAYKEVDTSKLPTISYEESILYDELAEEQERKEKARWLKRICDEYYENEISSRLIEIRDIVKCGDTEKIEKILKEDKYLKHNISKRYYNHKTVLHGAKTPEMVKLLIDNGADPNVKDCYGNTPLHRTLDPKIVRILLEHGADVNAKDDDGKTKLHRTNNPEIVRILLEHGADVNVKDDYGKTPLFYIENVQVARWLIAEGAE